MTSLTPTQLAVLYAYSVAPWPICLSSYQRTVTSLIKRGFLKPVYSVGKELHAITDSGRALLAEIDGKEKK